RARCAVARLGMQCRCPRIPSISVMRARLSSMHRTMCPSGKISDSPLDSGIQGWRINWLNQVFQKAGCPALGHVSVRAEAAHRDAGQSMLSAQLFQQLATRRIRQSDVTYEQVEGFFTGNGARLLRVPGCLDAVSSQIEHTRHAL